MSVAATRSCWAALIPMAKTVRPPTRRMVLRALIEKPSAIAPMSASASPRRMPGLRPYVSVILPTG